ncbi:MAG: pseudouridine synthase [Bacteroidales bacterium]
MIKERNNHDWNRENNRRSNRREDRYSHDKKSFNRENKLFERQKRKKVKDDIKFVDRDSSFTKRYSNPPIKGYEFDKKDAKFSKGDAKFYRFDRKFNNIDRLNRFHRTEKENPNRRMRAFEEYKRENAPNKRPRIQRDENGERIFKERRKESPNQVQPKQEEGVIRLNKYIANVGICSRREADVLITTGVIKVNDEIVTTLGYKVQPGDVVKYNGRILKNEKKIYILLNKPKGYITTSEDPQQRKTVMDLLDGACKERVYPVGRLDRMTTGLLLFTNDGELTKKLTHPSFGAQKVYNAELNRPLTKEDINKLLEGIELEDGVMKMDDVNWLNNVPLDKRKIGISLHSGKNRIIRRMFEALGYEVKKLDRVYFAGLTKKNLLRGQYRFLDNKEIGFLHMQR